MLKIKPNELKNWKYWAHLVVISLIVLVLLELWKGGEMLTLLNVIVGAGLIGIADIIAHTLLKLN